MHQPSDTQLRNLSRTVLTRHWVDQQAIEMGCFRGVVRLQGVLRHLGKLASTPADHAKAELIATEIRSIRGVKRVQMNFENRVELEKNGRKGELGAQQQESEINEVTLKSSDAVHESAA